MGLYKVICSRSHRISVFYTVNCSRMKMQALENSREMFLQMTLVYVVDVLLLQTGNQVLEDH